MSEKLEELISLLYQDRLTQYGKRVLVENIEKLQKEDTEQKADKQYIKQLENIVKFALTNHIGSLRGGMRIERYGIDKMQNLRLTIDYELELNSYVIRVNY